MKFFIKYFAFSEIKNSSRIILLGLIPVSIAILVLEFCFDSSIYKTSLDKYKVSNANLDIKYLIFYLTSGFTHAVLCFLVIWQFDKILKRDISQYKLTILSRARTMITITTFLLVYGLDYIEINISYLSHQRVYTILSSAEFYSNSFKVFPRDFFYSILDFDFFYIFSLFPFSLICIALAVMVFGSFAIGKELSSITESATNSVKELENTISIFNQKFKNIIFLLSLVLITSSIATVLLFQLPVPLIEDEVLMHIFQGESFAFGISWGVIFSLTLLFLCIYPYYKLHHLMLKKIKSERIKDDPSLEQWLLKNENTYSFTSNVKLLISIASPSIAGILTSIISNGI